MRRTYRMAGLNCAHCAGLIEKAVGELPGVSASELTLGTQTLAIEAAEAADYADLDARVEQCALSVEKGIHVICLDAEDPAAKQREAEEEEKRELRREIITLAAGALTFGISLLIPKGIASKALQYLAFAVLGAEIIWHAIQSLGKQALDEQLLMALATLGALCLGETAEACGVMLFYRLGELLQDQAVARSRRRITSLMSLRPDTAKVVLEAGVTETPARAVCVGDLIEVAPGERVPLDGVVEKGASEVDASALTGESVPVGVREGDEVASGSVNLSGLLRLRVTKPQTESAVQRILDLTESAVQQKANSERALTRFAQIYTPCVVALAAAVMLLGGLISGQWRVWIYRSLLLLMLSCPCALVLSVPLTFFAGIGSGSRHGVLFKGGQALEELSAVTAFAFDKTGTLTDGTLAIRAVRAAQGHEEGEVLRAAGLCERYSDHPVGRAIAEAAGDLSDEVTENEEEFAGEGVACLYDCVQYATGNGRLMRRFGVSLPADAADYSVHVAVDGKYIGSIALSDRVRPEAKDVLSRLSGARAVMLTGDVEAAARPVAEGLGIREVHAGLLPEDKMDCVKEMRGQDRVAFVGDGINDAPVLASANVGVAMGAMGRDAAIEAADVVLMHDSLEGLVTARTLAQRTMMLVRQNVALALGVKLVVMLLGILGYANMWLAVLGDVGVALLCVLNALRAGYIPGVSRKN